MKKINRFTKLLAVCITALALAMSGGCSKSSDTPSDTTADNNTGITTGKVVLSGTASKGPIGGGTVNVYALNADGLKGALLGSATTLADGSYSIDLGDYTGNVLAEVSGGTYKDEATNTVVTNTATFRAVVTDATGSVSASLTPLTELAVANAGTLTTANISASNNAISALLGGINLLTVKPADLNGAMTGASQAEKDYGLLLAALSQMSKDGGKTIAQIIADMKDDLADGKLDTTGAALSASITTFLTSTNNQSGLTVADSVLAVTVLAAGGSSDTTAPSVPTDLTATAASPAQIDLAWTKSSDTVAVTGYKVYRDGTYQKTTDGLAMADTGLSGKTKYCYSVSAIDAAKNESAKSAEVCVTTKAAPSAGVTWTSHTTQSSTPLLGIVWTGTQFVAVGGLGLGVGYISTSPDGITWTKRQSLSPYLLRGIAWSGQKFAAVGDYGTILTSTDGATWTNLTSSPTTTKQLNGIIWAGSKFVAVGDAGTIVTSTDGTAWTAVSTGTQYAFFSVAYGNGKYVIMPYKGNIQTSTDGLTWTAGPMAPFTVDAHAILTYGNGKLVCVGLNGLIMTSTDGTTWTTQTSGTQQNLNSVTWSGTQFAAAGNSNVIYTSPDGITWTGHDTGVTNSPVFHAIIWADTEFAATAYTSMDASLFVTAP